MKGLIEKCKQFRRIICYGAGKYGRIVCNYLSENGIDIDAFVVTGSYYRKSVLGKPVFDIYTYNLSQDGTGVIICGNSSIIESMKDTLEGMSFSDYFIVDDQLIESIDQVSRYDTKYDEKGRKRILLYHRVINLVSDPWRLSIDPEFFEWQIEYLHNNYDIVPFGEMEVDSSKEQVSITFDDGYFDNYSIVLPILERYGVPATIFVSSQNVGKEVEFWWDEIERHIYSNSNCPKRVSLDGVEYELENDDMKWDACWSIRNKFKGMNAKERAIALRELANVTGDNSGPRGDRRSVSVDELKRLDESPFISIGGHTVTHSCLASLERDEKKWEIEESKSELEKLLGHKLVSFAFPFGRKTDYDEETIRIALNAGYSHIAAVDMRYPKGELARYNPERATVYFEGRKIARKDWEREFMRFMILT